MEIEFYRSQTNSLPTFSLVLAASLIGLNSVVPSTEAPHESGKCALPASAQFAYYGPAEQYTETGEQVRALRRFAEDLLAKTEDSPQEVVDILNQHFWDVV